MTRTHRNLHRQEMYKYSHQGSLFAQIDRYLNKHMLCNDQRQWNQHVRIYYSLNKHVHFVFIVLAAFFISCNPSPEQQQLELRYDAPAEAWEETLPLGNGRIGMMPDGGIETERIVLNDITMWSGSEDPEAFSPEAINYLPEIQQLLLEGKNLEAQQMMYRHFRCGG